ncbi:MAG: DNA mismatch repair protein MutS [Planctomycetes bacterium]|nr:DNA mismatch repair protein MutS [Planctomycetota bacterium]
MMNQYLRLKREHQNAVLFFRLGDFYEMFYDDAKLASKALGLTLTSRAKGEKAVPMAGVPHHAADGYIQKLIRAGHKVAICDQLEDPEEAKGLVDRGVTRIITPGTLTEDAMLDGKAHNFLAAICGNGNRIGLSWVDLSTGAFQAEDVTRQELFDELARLNPSECLFPEEAPGSEGGLAQDIKGSFSMMLTPRAEWEFGRDTAYRALLDHFRTASLDGFGCEDLGPAIGAAGAILHYLQETQKVSLKHIAKIEKFASRSRLVTDKPTQQSLELTQTIRGRHRHGSLLWVLDDTHTSMGARLMHEWVTAPLRDVAEIQARQLGVKELFESASLRRDVRDALKGIYDIERLSTKVSCGRCNARDLVGLKQSLIELPKLKDTLTPCKAAIIKSLGEGLDILEDVRSLIGAAIAPNPPIALRDGGLIREGYDPDLDELRTIGKTGKSWLANFQAEEIRRTGIASLKVGYNKVFGYYIEVTNVHKEKIPQDYIRKQTLKNAERYITPQLKEYESRVLTADERAREMEYKIFQEVREQVSAQTPRLQETASVVAQIDVLASLAQVAAENGYVMPEVADDIPIRIVDGRHPVLEKTLEGEEFVPNDTLLAPDAGLMMVITGPNMAGKSTYIRQVALIVLMAQMGSFVPAREARIGVADRIFTRVGASDELARGQSTFMVEMNETANILNNATDRSLIILDEVGRGTSTFDGVSIAWAVTEFLHEHVKARTLFATHYHELTELALVLPGVKNYNIAVKEWKDEVIFLRKIVEGGTDKSYGIHVARLAGLPKEVIERAKVILHNLETLSLDVNDKPSFAPPTTEGPKPRHAQPTLFMTPKDLVTEALRKLDPAKLAPEDALKRLRELKKRLETG